MIIILYTKSQLILYIIIVSTLLTIIVGWVYINDEPKNAIEQTVETSKQTTTENKITIEIETDKEGDSNKAVEPVSLGNFRLTAYCSCELCCGKWANNRPVDENGNEIVYGSIGERLREGYSIAVDPNVIPYRSKVIINGNVYEAQDCGGAIKGNRIDVYHESHGAALDFGVQYVEVFIVSE